MALIDGVVVGWVCTRIHPEDSMGEVYVIAVDPDFQRQGIGRALMEYSQNRALDAGMTMMMVETGRLSAIARRPLLQRPAAVSSDRASSRKAAAPNPAESAKLIHELHRVCVGCGCCAGRRW